MLPLGLFPEPLIEPMSLGILCDTSEIKKLTHLLAFFDVKTYYIKKTNVAYARKDLLVEFLHRSELLIFF